LVGVAQKKAKTDFKIFKKWIFMNKPVLSLLTGGRKPRGGSQEWVSGAEIYLEGWNEEGAVEEWAI